MKNELLFALAMAACVSSCDVEEVSEEADSADTASTDTTDTSPDGSGPDSSPPCPWVGDLDLDDDAARAAFVASGCDEVHGDVFFVGSERSEIPSTPLRRVVGNVIISCNSGLASLNGLSTLEEVLGTDRDAFVGAPRISELEATGNEEHRLAYGGSLLVGVILEFGETGCDNPALPDVQGISSLRVVDQLLVYNNSNIMSLAGVETIEIVSALGVRHNPQLRTMDHFESLWRIWEGYSIHGNGCLPHAETTAFLERFRANGGQVSPGQFSVADNGEECE